MGINHIKNLNQKDLIILILFFLVLFGILLHSIYSPIILNPSETIGEAIRFERRGKVRVGVYQYTVNGKSYLVDGFDSAFNGDMFIVEYDPLNPARARVLSHRPTIPRTDSISFTFGVIIDRSIINRSITFEYQLGNDRYERLLILPPSESIRSNNYSIGNRINIEYSVENPNLARIRLE